MKEVFEKLVGDTVDLYEDALRHTDVVKLLKELKIHKACADAHAALCKHELEQVGEHDKAHDDELEIMWVEDQKEAETFKFVIDLIESGKFAGEC